MLDAREEKVEDSAKFKKGQRCEIIRVHHKSDHYGGQAGHPTGVGA